jgi:hypothetical protein
MATWTSRSRTPALSCGRLSEGARSAPSLLNLKAVNCDGYPDTRACQLQQPVRGRSRDLSLRAAQRRRGLTVRHERP